MRLQFKIRRRRHTNINDQACGLLNAGFQELFRGAKAFPSLSPRITPLHGDVFTAEPVD
jgi:hypothetical protein